MLKEFEHPQNKQCCSPVGIARAHGLPKLQAQRPILHGFRQPTRCEQNGSTA